MPTSLPLKKMTRDDKLRAMESLWADLTKHANKFDSPAWHAGVLRETQAAYKAGKAEFSDWEEAKQRVRRKAAKLA